MFKIFISILLTAGIAVICLNVYGIIDSIKYDKYWDKYWEIYLKKEEQRRIACLQSMIEFNRQVLEFKTYWDSLSQEEKEQYRKEHLVSGNISLLPPEVCRYLFNDDLQQIYGNIFELPDINPTEE